MVWALAYWGLGEIDELLVPRGKASKLLTDHLITGKPHKSEPAQEKWFSQTIHTYKPYWLDWVVIIFYEAHLECHDILTLGKSPIKRRLCLETALQPEGYGYRENPHHMGECW